MAKNVRNLLAVYEVLDWPGEGQVKWSYVQRLQELQDQHGLRLGNKLTSKHTNFFWNKMKVNLAVQVLSDSVARTLKWCHDVQLPGFEDQDVLVTARFLELHDQLFDILNSRSKFAYGYKAAISPQNIAQAEIVFAEFISMYQVKLLNVSIIQYIFKIKHVLFQALERSDGVKITRSQRRTGPLGFIACIATVRSLVRQMETGELDLEYLRCYKMAQDHLEQFFSSIRMRNGWSYNPSPQQFRYAFRQLLCHVGKGIIHDVTGTEIIIKTMLNSDLKLEINFYRQLHCSG